MPRIRKKTSNRQSTNDRKKISQKARESRKKASKKAKKAPEQWTSKQKKDPGIPNNYPYKDEILKEMQESRRLAVEEKERQKEANRARKASAKNAAASEDVDMASENEDEDESSRKLTAEEVADGIADITARSFPASKAQARTKHIAVAEEEEEEEEVPVLLNRDLPDLGKTIDSVDAVVYVLDARDPLPFKSTDLEEVLKSKKKKVMFVLNKVDLCPKESVSAWLSTLQSQSTHPIFPFRSSSAQLPSAHESPSQPRKKSSALFPKDDSWASDAIISQLDQWASKGKPLSVAVVGVTNVGKSSFINSLAQKSALPVYSIASCSRGATTTTLPQEITLNAPSGRTIRLIDTPGLSFQNPQSTEEQEDQDDDDEKAAREETRALDILHRNRGRIDKLKDPKAAASQIIARASYEDLMLFYNLPAFMKGNVDSFLTGLARSQRLVKKVGIHSSCIGWDGLADDIVCV